MTRFSWDATCHYEWTPVCPSGTLQTHKGGVQAENEGPTPGAVTDRKLKMAGVGGRCDAACGCLVPCPGGSGCRCRTNGSSAEGHTTCPCGAHCGCNPCTCPRGGVTGTGKLYCKCGDGCTCVKCSA